MQTQEVTILIPSMKPLEESTIIRSYLASDIRAKLFVQFVYLANTRKAEKKASEIQDFDDHQILLVGSDRYFGTVEENIYRAQDFAGLFKRQVFCIGEHDIIDWEWLFNAIESFQQRELQVMGWNILVKQLRPDGSYARALSFAELGDKTAAYAHANTMFDGGVLDGAIGFPAMLSVYGPMDWAAFIGNQLYTREAFLRVISYKCAEPIYSFPYKQLRYFREHNAKYGLFPDPVIHRVSDDFLKMGAGTHSLGWLEDHRTVQGGSPSFWIVHLLHLSDIPQDQLFNAVAYSYCLSQVPENNEIRYGRNIFLAHCLSWARAVILHLLEGKSYYFPDQTGSASLQDLYYIKLFLARLLCAAQTAVPNAALPLTLQLPVAEALHHLNDYFASTVQDATHLTLALNRVNTAGSHLTPPIAAALSQESFIDLTSSGQ